MRSQRTTSSTSLRLRASPALGDGGAHRSWRKNEHLCRKPDTRQHEKVPSLVSRLGLPAFIDVAGGIVACKPKAKTTSGRIGFCVSHNQSSCAAGSRPPFAELRQMLLVDAIDLGLHLGMPALDHDGKFTHQPARAKPVESDSFCWELGQYICQCSQCFFERDHAASSNRAGECPRKLTHVVPFAGHPQEQEGRLPGQIDPSQRL